MLKITRQVTLLLLAGALSFPAYSYQRKQQKYWFLKLLKRK